MVQVVIGEQRGEGVRCDLSPNPDPYATPPPNSPPPPPDFRVMDCAAWDVGRFGTVTQIRMQVRPSQMTVYSVLL